MSRAPYLSSTSTSPSSPSSGRVTNFASLASSHEELGPREDLPLAPFSGLFLPTNDNPNDLHHLLCQLQMTDSGNQQHTQRDITSDRTVDDERQANNAEVVWGMSLAQMGQRHQGQQQTPAPMPSGVESSGQIFEGQPFNPSRFYSPLAPPASMAPRSPPPGIHINCE